MTSRQNSTAGVRGRTPGSLRKGRANATKTSRAVTSIKTLQRQHRRHQWAPSPKRVSPWPTWAAPPSRTIFARRHGRPSSGRTCRKNTMEHQTRWSSCRCTSPLSWQQVETRCDGDVFSCRLIRTCPDLAHEPRHMVNLHLGRALRMVRCKLRQRLPATWRGGPPTRSEAEARRDPPDVYLLLHQGTRYYTSYFRCLHHHGLPTEGA
jgi:hypothetical protein